MNKYLLMLSCITIFSCSPEDIKEDSEENLMEGVIEGTTEENEALFGTWVANKITINNEELDKQSCELGSSIVLFSDNVYSDRFFTKGESGCEPGFINGAWESEDDRIILNYNDGTGVYLIWQVLEVSEEKLSLKLLSIENEKVSAENEQLWEYNKS